MFNKRSENIFVIDKQMGDVNGDEIVDTVYLVGESENELFYEKLNLIIRDGKTMQSYIIPLAEGYNKAYNPWLFLGNFTTLESQQIMINLPTGGSGGLTYYFLFSFEENQIKTILSPKKDQNPFGDLIFKVNYEDDYKVLVENEVLGQFYRLDVRDREDSYKGIFYNEKGELIKPLKGFVIEFPLLTPIRFDGKELYRLQAQQSIAGTSMADRLGYAMTYWEYDQQNGNWDLNPDMFFMIV